MDPFLDEQEQAGAGFDPLSVLRAFWRRKMLFFVPFVLCLSMSIIAIKTMTPIYASSGQVKIKFDGLNSNLLTDPSRRYGRERDIDNIAYRELDMLLTSPGFLEMVVRELRLQDAILARPVNRGTEPLSEERAVAIAMRRLDRMMRLERDGARLFLLRVRDPDPVRAYNIATLIVEKLIEEYRASQMASSTSTREFLQGQLESQQLVLATSEETLNSYLVSMAAETLLNNPINAMNLSDAQTNLLTVRSRYDGTDSREFSDLEQGMRRLLGDVPRITQYQTDDVVRSTVMEIENVGLDLQLLAAGAAETRELETRLGQLRVGLNTQIETLIALDYPSLGFLERNQISQFVYFTIYRSGTKRVMDNLDLKIQEFRDFTTRRPAQSARMAELQEDVTSANELVASIEREITRHTMNLEASISEIGMQITVRKAPAIVYFPVEPDKLKLTAMGVVLSIGIGMGLVLLAIFLDRSFNAVEDIERTLGVTVIGTLPVIQDDHFERKKKVRYLRWITIILGIIAVGAVGFLVIYPRLG